MQDGIFIAINKGGSIIGRQLKICFHISEFCLAQKFNWNF